MVWQSLQCNFCIKSTSLSFIIIIIMIIIIIIIIIIIPLFTLGGIYSTNPSGAEQMPERNKSNQTYQD